MKSDEAPERVEQGRLPRVTRLLVLAHRMEEMLRSGAVKDYAELARLGGVSRARVTQIMNLLLLAPDIQEQILSMPRLHASADPMSERDLRGITGYADWADQRERFKDP